MSAKNQFSNDSNKSEIDELNERLYSRTSYKEPDADERSDFDERKEVDIEEDWQTPELDDMLKEEREEPETHPIMKKFFIFSIIFFVAAVILAGVVFLGGSNFVSSKNVDITVVGPTNVASGDVLELGVTIQNKNNADLEVANLSIQYPQGTRDADNTDEALNFTREELGEIRAGREVTRNTRSVFFGAEGEVKEIKFSVEYKVKGSSATFYKDKIYEVIIGEAPLTLTVVSDGQVDSGESFVTSLEIALAPSAKEVKGVMVRAEYPYGYTLESSSPEAVANNNVWSLGDLTPGESKTVVLRGNLLGENEEERTFRFYAGVADAGGGNPNFKTVVASTLNTVAIARPSVSLALIFNGEDSQTYVAPATGVVNGMIRAQNNLTERLINPRLELTLSGQALDNSSISSPEAFYDSGSNRLIWEITNPSGQRELAPGERVQVSFNFSSYSDLPASPGARVINARAVLSGVPAGSGSNRALSVTEDKVVRIASEVNFTARTLYSQGSFQNSGPIPPKAEETTTYAVVWTIGNTQALIEDARATARLGTNVSWLGTSPDSGESVTYNEAENTVTWDLGTVATGAGYSLPSRSATFQVSLTPSTSQIGTEPTLVNNITFIGSDVSTGEVVQLSASSLTTSMPSDPIFVQGDGRVAPK